MLKKVIFSALLVAGLYVCPSEVSSSSESSRSSTPTIIISIEPDLPLVTTTPTDQGSAFPGGCPGVGIAQQESYALLVARRQEALTNPAVAMSFVLEELNALHPAVRPSDLRPVRQPSLSSLDSDLDLE
ncbi:MAG: hypothetical protein NTU89_02080 [Candidatus Dependentiae bacterium]|nr:hypothetical protein [Candidatus Dependentiae bacterium]